MLLTICHHDVFLLEIYKYTKHNVFFFQQLLLKTHSRFLPFYSFYYWGLSCCHILLKKKKSTKLKKKDKQTNTHTYTKHRLKDLHTLIGINKEIHCRAFWLLWLERALQRNLEKGIDLECVDATKILSFIPHKHLWVCLEMFYFFTLSNISCLPSSIHKMKPILSLHQIFLKKMTTLLNHQDAWISEKHKM